MAESSPRRRRYPDGLALRDWHAPDGWRHRAFALPAAAPARGSLLFQAGRGDFLEKYLELYADLARRGWAVEGFDWRDQGGSARRVPADDRAGFDPLVADLGAFAADWRARTPGPHALVAHSMGGYVALLALAAGLAVDAAVLAAPMLALDTRPLPPALARLTAAGAIGLGLGARPAWRDRHREPARRLRLTADVPRYDDAAGWAADVGGLESGVPNWHWIAAALAAPARIAAAPLEGVSVPVLLLVPGLDRLVDPRAADAVAARLPHARLVRFPAARHELLREADAQRDPALAAIDGFLDRVAPAQ